MIFTSLINRSSYMWVNDVGMPQLVLPREFLAGIEISNNKVLPSLATMLSKCFTFYRKVMFNHVSVE